MQRRCRVRTAAGARWRRAGYCQGQTGPRGGRRRSCTSNPALLARQAESNGVCARHSTACCGSPSFLPAGSVSNTGGMELARFHRPAAPERRSSAQNNRRRRLSRASRRRAPFLFQTRRAVSSQPGARSLPDQFCAGTRGDIVLLVALNCGVAALHGRRPRAARRASSAAAVADAAGLNTASSSCVCFQVGRGCASTDIPTAFFASAAGDSVGCAWPSWAVSPPLAAAILARCAAAARLGCACGPRHRGRRHRWMDLLAPWCWGGRAHWHTARSSQAPQCQPALGATSHRMRAR
jgi:hypothetical protein